MKILLIEDDDTICQFIKNGLEAESYIVDTVADGEHGSFMARVNDYNLLLIDYILPKKNGLEICRDVRQANKRTPIIMLTVCCDDEYKIALFKAGADDYITKPFNFEELLLRIKAILRRPVKELDRIMKIENIILNATNFTVKRNSNNINLTKKEFQLLEYLLENKGQILSRAKIMENVWDMNADPFSNTVEAHILNLRKKLNHNNQTNLIHTISGRGYKIDTHK